jgi:hypothetical protein
VAEARPEVTALVCIYDAEAAELVYTRTLEFLRRHLA